MRFFRHPVVSTINNDEYEIFLPFYIKCAEVYFWCLNLMKSDPNELRECCGLESLSVRCKNDISN